MGFMARDLWLRDGSRSALSPLLRVSRSPGLPPHHLLLFLEAITCIYRYFSPPPPLEDGEEALTDPLVHIAETSCAFTVKERALRGRNATYAY